jgi:methanethiol S-methyltransferase
MTSISTNRSTVSVSARDFPAPLNEPAVSRPGGIAIFAYSCIAYGSFLAAILYAIGFVGGWAVPKSIDTGTPGPVLLSLLINTGLLILFVLQHTIMARPAFKRWWTTVIPKAAERSTFVLLASASLGVIFWLWQPAPGPVWSAEQPWAVIGLNALSLVGWGIVFLSSFLVSHADLFGLRQGWLRLCNREYFPVGFRLIGLYKLVRHPLMLGFLIAVWSAPHMTVGRLFFAAMITGYIFFGTWMEERDLIAEHGRAYLEYRRKVRAFIPLPRRSA